jgi:DNA-binding NarL/FixJ family response regulator
VPAQARFPCIATGQRKALTEPGLQADSPLQHGPDLGRSLSQAAVGALSGHMPSAGALASGSASPLALALARAAANAPSSASRARPPASGTRWPYRSTVVVSDLCPSQRASAASLDAAIRDVEMLQQLDITLISTLTLMNAKRAGLGLDGLSRMIVIVPTSQPQQLEIAARASAVGYIMQHELTPQTLWHAISGALAGQLVIPDAIAAYLLSRVREQPPVRHLGHLRPREAQVLELIVSGASNKEIARRLRISVHGVIARIDARTGHRAVTLSTVNDLIIGATGPAHPRGYGKGI